MKVNKILNKLTKLCCFIELLLQDYKELERQNHSVHNIYSKVIISITLACKHFKIQINLSMMIHARGAVEVLNKDAGPVNLQSALYYDKTATSIWSHCRSTALQHSMPSKRLLTVSQRTASAEEVDLDRQDLVQLNSTLNTSIQC